MFWRFLFESYIYLMLYVTVAYSCSVLLLAEILKVQICEINIFHGKIKRKILFRDILINFRSIPTGASFVFLNIKDGVSSGTHHAQRKLGYKAFDEVPIYKQAFLMFSGCIGLSVFCVPVLGADSFYKSVTDGVFQIISGGLAPCSKGMQYLTSFFDVYKQSKVQAFAMLSSKQIAFNLIPVAGTPIHMLAYNYFMRNDNKATLKIVNTIGVSILMFMLIPLFGWLVAMVSYSFPAFGSQLCG